MDGFDFSQLKWVLIVAVAIIFNIIKAKQPVKVQEPSDEMLDDMDEDVSSELEDLMRKLNPNMDTVSMPSSGLDSVEEPAARRQKKVVKASRKVAPQSKVPPVENRLTSDKNGGEDESNFAEEFDLRKAVIMSEILTRKYDE